MGHILGHIGAGHGRKRSRNDAEARASTRAPRIVETSRVQRASKDMSLWQGAPSSDTLHRNQSSQGSKRQTAEANPHRDHAQTPKFLSSSLVYAFNSSKTPSSKNPPIAKSLGVCTGEKAVSRTTRPQARKALCSTGFRV